MDVKVKVIEMFNDKLGYVFNNFKMIKEMHTNLEHNKNKVEEYLSLASSEVPSRIQETIKEVNDIMKSADRLKKSCEFICINIKKKLEQENKICEVQDTIDDITYLARLFLYLQFVQFIEDISVELEVSLISGNDEACVSSYVILKESCQNVQISLCTNLKNYINNTLQFWYNQIKKNLIEEYSETLKTLKWPFCGNNSQAINTHTQESITRFKIITQHLFHLQLPDNMIDKRSSEFLSSFSTVCLPVALLIHPLKQRFLYHFTGIKQTNRRDKPEWFFTQILTWIKNHSEWLENIVQPVADAAGLKNINIKVEFMRALVSLAVEKLNSELCIVQYDDSLFAHTVDEALGFERELKGILLYPSADLAIVFVLTQPQFFIKWITMEKKYATEKMDAILSSETAWSRLPGFETDEMKVTECSEAFLILLSTISDRYNHLPQPGHRLQFLDLQLELIDDFRVRLLQLLRENYKDPLLSLMPSILNTLYYVSIVLQNWGITVPFLKLYFFKKQFENFGTIMHDDAFTKPLVDDNEHNLTVFDEVISLLQRLEKKLMIEIGDSVFAEITAKSKLYCNEKWFAMSSEKDVVSLSITASGCSMFQEIVNQLHALHNSLALPLFEQSWQNLAIRLDQYLLDEIILRNKFNTGGAFQLQFDIKRNLLPLFGLYTNKIELYFALTVEACILLNMLPGAAFLLIETLENADEDTRTEILADVKIQQLTSNTALKILKTRMDINYRSQEQKSFEID
ncbi:PREDICTED: RAD50-interacting protein 1 [Ceratosolen solmsi marchali]|uniref:RAD50-interacting protein 1 n=1 Tax=Ceratosolen solmsi marchali TaxID=326594 RepID=A0AAJ7E088_9HYME|nr:PREDICTED: RAD50-interacting protein 1 [Ceratosolen solmsi marchali]